MAYTRVQNSGHFLATLAWLRHLGLTGVCADCNNKISYKKIYFRNLDLSNLTDNRKFWRAIKPVFAEKIKTTPSITLEQNGELLSDDRKNAELATSSFTLNANNCYLFNKTKNKYTIYALYCLV